MNGPAMYVPMGVAVKAVQLTAEMASELGRGKEGDWIIEDDDVHFLMEGEYFKKRFMPVKALRLLVTVSEPIADTLTVTVAILNSRVDQTPFIEAAHESLQAMLTRDDEAEVGLAH